MFNVLATKQQQNGNKCFSFSAAISDQQKMLPFSAYFFYFLLPFFDNCEIIIGTDVESMNNIATPRKRMVKLELC